MTLPNQLTFLRIGLAILCIYWTLQASLSGYFFALVLFIFASITDLIDGIIARKYNLITDLGKLMDPIADKILTMGVFLAFLQVDIVNLWVVLAIAVREFGITAMRMVALKKGKVLAAEKLGKHKTGSQIFTIIATYLILIGYHYLPDQNIISWLYSFGIDIMMAYVLAITLISGFYYLWVNRKIIKTF